MTTSSRLPGFYNKNRDERLQAISEQAALTPEEIAAFLAGLNLDGADHMIENVVGAVDFRVRSSQLQRSAGLPR